MKISITYLSVLFSIFLLFSCNENTTEQTIQDAYSINADLSDCNYTKAYLGKFEDGKMNIIDSSDIANGHFSFNGTIDLPEVRYISFNSDKTIIPLFVENSSITIKGSATLIDSVTVNGSVSNDEYRKFTSSLTPFENKQKAIVEQFYALPQDASEEEKMKLENEYDEIDIERVNFIEKYVTENNAKVTSAYIALRYLVSQYEVDQLEKLFNTFDEKIKSSSYVKVLEDRLKTIKQSMIGGSAPIFSQNDSEGNPISIENFKGKFLLIDFWASWCAPCRAENPNVVSAFNKYHEKGFEILGVSLDEDKDKWLAAIEKDGLTWSHVSDLKGWENEAAKLYGVQGIPHSVLVDKEGNIIAKNLRGEELHKKLEEVLANE